MHKIKNIWETGVDRQAGELGFDDGYFGRKPMSRIEYGKGARGYGDYLKGHHRGEAYRRLGVVPGNGFFRMDCIFDGETFVMYAPTLGDVAIGHGDGFQAAKLNAFKTMREEYPEEWAFIGGYDIEENDAARQERINNPKDDTDRYVSRIAAQEARVKARMEEQHG